MSAAHVRTCICTDTPKRRLQHVATLAGRKPRREIVVIIIFYVWRLIHTFYFIKCNYSNGVTHSPSSKQLKIISSKLYHLRLICLANIEQRCNFVMQIHAKIPVRNIQFRLLLIRREASEKNGGGSLIICLIIDGAPRFSTFHSSCSNIIMPTTI